MFCLSSVTIMFRLLLEAIMNRIDSLLSTGTTILLYKMPWWSQSVKICIQLRFWCIESQLEGNLQMVDSRRDREKGNKIYFIFCLKKTLVFLPFVSRLLTLLPIQKGGKNKQTNTFVVWSIQYEMGLNICNNQNHLEQKGTSQKKIKFFFKNPFV
jgi:hypothetical protein